MAFGKSLFSLSHSLSLSLTLKPYSDDLLELLKNDEQEAITKTIIVETRLHKESAAIQAAAGRKLGSKLSTIEAKAKLLPLTKKALEAQQFITVSTPTHTHTHAHTLTHTHTHTHTPGATSRHPQP